MPLALAEVSRRGLGGALQTAASVTHGDTPVTHGDAALQFFCIIAVFFALQFFLRCSFFCAALVHGALWAIKFLARTAGRQVKDQEVV